MALLVLYHLVSWVPRWHLSQLCPSSSEPPDWLCCPTSSCLAMGQSALSLTNESNTYSQHTEGLSLSIFCFWSSSFYPLSLNILCLWKGFPRSAIALTVSSSFGASLSVRDVCVGVIITLLIMLWGWSIMSQGYECKCSTLILIVLAWRTSLG